MNYGIGGMTKNHEFELAVEIISNHKGVKPETFRRGVDNVFSKIEAAKSTLAELKSRKELSGCCWHLYEVSDKELQELEKQL